MAKKTTKKKVRMTESELADLARSYKEAQEQIKQWEEIKRESGRQIIEELKTRKTGLIEIDDDTSIVRISHTKQERTIYDFHGLAEVLKPKQLRLIQKQDIDPSALSRMVQAGEIPAEVVLDHSEVVTHAEYPTISFPAE